MIIWGIGDMISQEEMRKVESLYSLYGFQESIQNDNYMVFTYSNGYFDNAEIVWDGKERPDDLKKEYESLGYSVRELKYQSYQKLHEFLFKGFFGLADINKKLENEYKRFYELQTKKLEIFNAEYQYVEPTYYWNNHIGHEKLANSILEQIKKRGAQLVILEAAAGYGKTCTSYELIKAMALDPQLTCVPIFTELSKNRRAALFRYVLLDEIDRKFTRLSSKVVISEIQNGRVPLIIDGFDELISRSNPNMDSGTSIQDEDAQTMLDTIADLFEECCETKVVLTSRKSAIFTGDDFNNWVEAHLPNCEVTRISIEEPTIQDWIGFEKKQFLESQRIPFASIVNPILLAYMRSMEMDTFKAQCENVEKVIDHYFQSLLDREMERQSLSMKADEQYLAMKHLAKFFVEFDIMSEELSFIRDLFIEIIHDSFKDYRDRYYSSEERPTEEDFATKLAGHALINRISATKNQIGFINDFVFGIFIGDNIIEENIAVDAMETKYIDIACTAYASRAEDKRLDLLSAVLPYRNRLNYEQQLDLELKLALTIQQNYVEHYISNRTFHEDIYFDGTYGFSNCTFRNCTFHGCYLTTSAFSSCSFYDCRFYDISVMCDTSHNCHLIFSGNCVGYEEFAEAASHEEPPVQEENYEKAILRKYWSASNRYLRGSLPEKVILTGFSQEERPKIQNALENLRREGLLFKNNHTWLTNKEKIKEIRDILEK